MRELPEEDDGKHHQRAPLQPATSGGPAQHARHGSRESADKGADRVNFLQRRIGAEIDGRSSQRQPCGQRIQRETQVERAAERHQNADQRGMHEAEASGRDRTLRGAAHAAVGVPLHHFIQGGGSARNQADPQQSVKQRPRKGRDAGLQRSEVVSAPRGHDDQRGHAQLGQFGVVARQGQSAAARNHQRLCCRTHAATGFRSRLGICSLTATGLCRHTCTASTAVVASSNAPTATCATVETTMGSSGWTASCPQATRVRNATNPGTVERSSARA